MSLTLQLPPQLEADLRSAAAREGVPPEMLAVSALQDRLRRETEGDADDTESVLLARIGVGLPAEIWERYHELISKRRDETLLDVEYAELLRLTEEVEQWNAERLELLLRLARLRGISLRTLVEELGLAPRPDE